MPTESTSNTDVASQILGILGQESGGAGPGAVTADLLRRCTRDQLLEMARRLGLTGVSKLSKDLLAGRILVAFEVVVGAEGPQADEEAATETHLEERTDTD